MDQDSVGALLEGWINLKRMQRSRSIIQGARVDKQLAPPRSRQAKPSAQLFALPPRSSAATIQAGGARAEGVRADEWRM
jgi:hypothetical protein